MKQLSAAPTALIAALVLVSVLGASAARAGQDFRTYLPVVQDGASSPAQPAPTVPTPAPSPVAPTPAPVDVPTLRAQLIAAINAERAAVGCAPAVAEPSLTAAAQAWSDEMARTGMRHSDYTWYPDHGYTRTDWVSENLAGADDDPPVVVAMWMQDEGHRNVVLAGCDRGATTVDAGVGFTAFQWTLAMGEHH